MSTYYVATTGNDTTGNGSLSTPWATPQKAATVMVAGDTCNILAGTYTTTIPYYNNVWNVEIAAMIAPQSSGTAGNFITFQNYNNGVVNLNMNVSLYTSDETFFVNTNGQSYINIIGLNFNAATNFGIVCMPTGSWGNPPTGTFGSNINIINCTASGCADAGICGLGTSSTVGTTYVTVNNCTVSGTNSNGTDEQIFFNGGNNITVEYCTVSNPTGANRCGINFVVGCSTVSCHHNTVYGTGSMGIYINADGVPMSNIAIYDNIVYNNGNTGYGGGGIAIGNEAGTGATTGVNIYNNIIYGNARGFRVDQFGTETTTFTFVNNTLYNNGTTTEIFINSTHTYLTSCIIRNNIFFSLTNGAYGISYADYANGGITVDHNLFYNSGGSWSGSNVFGTSDVLGNPLLVSPTTNFALTTGSPAIGAGTATGQCSSTDYIGNVWLNPPCIGAYQYAVTQSLTPGTVNHNSGQGTTAAQYISTSHHTLTMPAAIDARINNALTSSDAAVIDAIRTALINMGMMRAS